jgi:hypothetical protein
MESTPATAVAHTVAARLGVVGPAIGPGAYLQCHAGHSTPLLLNHVGYDLINVTMPAGTNALQAAVDIAAAADTAPGVTMLVADSCAVGDVDVAVATITLLASGGNLTAGRALSGATSMRCSDRNAGLQAMATARAVDLPRRLYFVFSHPGAPMIRTTILLWPAP